MIAVYLDDPSIRIEPCVTRWVYLSDENRSVLGQQGCRLGDDATIGERVRDSAGKFRVHIGPVNLETYRRYLPGGDLRESLQRLIPIAAGDWLAHDVCVVLRSEDTSKLGLVLGADSQLGWTTGFFSESTGDISVTFD
jgi:type VI secretion system protein ImpH